METVRGIKIRTILLDNNNWLNFYNKFKHLIRLSIVINVCKLLACGTAFLGFHHYTCQTCGNSKKVFHTCKSRFCSSCGKKSTEEWIAKNLALLPQTPWQHILNQLESWTGLCRITSKLSFILARNIS